jgi:Tol biopolymer transport system component
MARFSAIAYLIAIVIAGSVTAEAQGFAQRVSVGFDGAEPDLLSCSPSLSESGRYVAFQSYASNLVPDDTNGCADVFVFDRKNGSIRRVSVSSSGLAGDLYSGEPAISADGRCVAFRSDATNLVPNDTNGCADVFVHEIPTGRTYRVSVGPAGAQGNGPSGAPSISRDWRFVAFESSASNLVQGDQNGVQDVFVRDRDGLSTIRVSVGQNGEGDADSGAPSISRDGRSVAFTSMAARFAGESEYDLDVFLFESKPARLTLVSADRLGRPAGGDHAAISGDGAVVVFDSAAALRADDQNADRDVYAWRVFSKRMMLVSVATSGQPGRGFSAERDFGPAIRIPADSTRPSITSDGRYVAFTSLARGLVPGAALGAEAYVRDLDLSATRCVSADASGRFSAAPCAQDDVLGAIECPPVTARISGDGRVVGIVTQGAMIPSDGNATDDVYVVEIASSYDASARVEGERKPK